MKTISTFTILKLIFAASAIALASTSAFAKKGMPDVTHEGLERIKGDGTADYIYVHPEGDVLLVRATISDLSINAPDPNNTAGIWSRVYAESAGDATLTIELYDSVTEQILARAIDTKIDIGDSFGWREERTHYSNVNDAREALNSWAKDLVKGLQRAMSASAKSD